MPKQTFLVALSIFFFILIAFKYLTSVVLSWKDRARGEDIIMPTGHIWLCLKTFSVATTGGWWVGEVYWHLVDRGQGCYYTSRNAQGSPNSKEVSGPKRE